ncbi:tRNA(His) guanylyltransferase 1-like [Impatiens glandulifera]|uniref:tRNA(His) guanylyltransferase 1-like n=1 Tax=Impatiens glandulifera TaxID=253017 RepID=UPI001FB07E8C|nr:tRNA(His) guanylyltransferase 1-like [Impatiens glandulifera]
MANSKYEYVKSFEVEDEVMLPNIIVVRINNCNICRLSDVHELEKPNDERLLNLMNSCAISVLEEFSDIVFSYGYGDEHSFVFKKSTKFYQRRSSKILSLIVSFFTTLYVTKWKEYFPDKDLQYPPSFESRVISCASSEVVQMYLAWRQIECHESNQYNTCLWMLIKCGKKENDAREALKGTQKQGKHELLFKQFGVNYKNLPSMFRQGSCILKTEVEDIVKYNDSGVPVKRLRKKVILVHSGQIASSSFWNGHTYLCKEVGEFGKSITKLDPDYIKSFQFENKMMLSTWIVVRIDGVHFHRFCDAHQFEKPNDEQALNLMNACASSVLEEFQDIVFSYGVSDEYSFVFKKDSQFYQRHASGIVSVIVSFFSSMYIMKWREHFPKKELKCLPYFDGRAVCYPSTGILKDYLTWRQVDCHINNQYNTCFWMLVKSGMSKRESQEYLKGSQTNQKNELLIQKFGIDYKKLPAMFRLGSSVFWDKEENIIAGKSRKIVVVDCCNIIDESFWDEHATILA